MVFSKSARAICFFFSAYGNFDRWLRSKRREFVKSVRMMDVRTARCLYIWTRAAEQKTGIRKIRSGDGCAHGALLIHLDRGSGAKDGNS